MNVYLTSAVKLNFVKFHCGTSMQTPHSVPTSSAIQLLFETYLKDIHRQNDIMCVNNTLTRDEKY